MSSGQDTSQAGVYDNGSSRAVDPTSTLTDKERATLTKVLANPLDFPAEFPGWLDDFIRLRLSVKNISGLGSYGGYTGELLVVLKDYTANVGVFTLEAKGATWMYLNGATFDGGTYPELNTYLGTTTLPDTRGRSIWLCGTNAATDLFDNDGVSESSRQPKHTHSDNFTVDAGSLAISPNPHSHSGRIGGSGSALDGTGGGQDFTTGSTSLSITGDPTISGSVGSGMSGSDAVAHIVLGSAFVHV